VSKMAWLCGKCRYRGPLSGDRPTYRCTRCGANAEWWRHYPLPPDRSTTYPRGLEGLRDRLTPLALAPWFVNKPRPECGAGRVGPAIARGVAY